ncbi:tyrosine-type recombinase/integrase [Burkholderia sp. BCC1993]|uniref:tyrosine-type recombinase/integrase n=1 Tax=Burkholderia sp. BCC1993 TaxID=2817444 RepID=UPI002AB0B957|nr:tyrosine-type recombinase/integrase [Burkholderia sp. BCC1993]
MDTALGDSDASRVCEMSADFYVDLTANADYTTADVQCWDSVRKFVLHFARYWAVSSDAWGYVIGAINGTGRIRTPRRGRIAFARALPDVALKELLAVAEPGAGRNPFVSASVQARNWLIVLLLLLCGLRRGESLLLTVDSLKHGVDSASGESTYWLDVTTTDDDEDERSSRPSIKTVESHRQVRISEELAASFEAYVAEYRADSDSHRFLLTAKKGNPLSAESVNKMFATLSAAISPEAMKRFQERTGSKLRISPHDLRHTCATVRYDLFLKSADFNRDLAMQRMRAFFGWALESDMPDLYARAAIQDDLLRSWNDVFDRRITVLRKGQS